MPGQSSGQSGVRSGAESGTIVPQYRARSAQNAPDFGAPATGVVLDLGLLRIEAEKIRALLDHRMLDTIEGLGRPTLENLCAFIARQVQAGGLPLSAVALWRDGIGDRCTLRLG